MHVSYGTLEAVGSSHDPEPRRRDFDHYPMNDEPTMTKSPIQSEVERVLDAMRPVIQEDGGDIELVSVDEAGNVKIRFQGACVSCPSRAMTLQSLIERNLREYVPGFASVTAEEA